MSKIEEALGKAYKLREHKTALMSEKINIPEVIQTREVSNHCLVTVTQPDSPITEEYRRLKSMLLRETKADFLNTIMVTSSIDSEGKTLTAINLAITLAQEIDHSILLVDADLRKPMTHNYLGIKYKYGLSDYLTQDIDISDILIKTGIGKLVLLPAGNVANNPVELLSSEKMKKLVKELKQRYMDRYIIIDTPPILSCAEGLSLGSYVDGIVFVVREGHAQKNSIEDALNMIKGLNIIGVVFNNVHAMHLNGHYPRYYYKYNYKKREG